VGGIAPAKFWLSGRRISFEIAADVSSREPLRAQAGELEMREILADAAARFEYVCQRAGDCGCGRIKRKILVDPSRQIANGIKDRAARRKRTPGVIEISVPDGNER
jgi:hypothetical protein